MTTQTHAADNLTDTAVADDPMGFCGPGEAERIARDALPGISINYGERRAAEAAGVVALVGYWRDLGDDGPCLWTHDEDASMRRVEQHLARWRQPSWERRHHRHQSPLTGDARRVALAVLRTRADAVEASKNGCDHREGDDDPLDRYPHL